MILRNQHFVFWLSLTAVCLTACTESQDSQALTTDVGKQPDSTTADTSNANPSVVKASFVRKNNTTECPRLIQKKVDNSQVLRHDSMSGKNCDYFIYPSIGDVVTATVSNGRLAPSLIRPYVHDFANGSYQVQQAGRHVIRLEYDAFGKKPDKMDYVLTVDIASPNK